jgi:hypothetical protein
MAMLYEGSRHAQDPALDLPYGAFSRRELGFYERREAAVPVSSGKPSGDAVGVVLIAGPILARERSAPERRIDLGDGQTPGGYTQPLNGQKCTRGPSRCRMKRSQGMPACADFATAP